MTSFDRYSRQTRFAPLGEAGQQRLLHSTALICGCGALGTVLANTLVRAGVGFVRIVDRDFVDRSNLQRQVLFDEEDVANCWPKAVAAAEKLRKINSEVTIEPIVADVDATNLPEFCRDVDVMLDGTDNFETRFLLNDAAVKWGIPWVYGGCLGANGQTMTILPGRTPCLRCLMPEIPSPGTTPTCDTAGVLGSIIGVIASLEATEALKILSGNLEAVNRKLTIVDVWENSFRQMSLDALASRDDCPTCGKEPAFPWLEGQRGHQSTVLCGRNSVQLAQSHAIPLDFDDLETKLRPVGKVQRNPFLLRFSAEGYTLTLFPDGRAIISGTEEIAAAKNFYSKYLGM